MRHLGTLGWILAALAAAGLLIIVLALCRAAKLRDRQADEALGSGTLHENGIRPKDRRQEYLPDGRPAIPAERDPEL